MDSLLSLAILGHLSLRMLSGYSMRKIFMTTAWKSFSSSPGAIYPALQRLEAAGFIKGTVEKGNTLRPRKTYGLTGKGKKILIDQLSQPVTREDLVGRLNFIPLRFAFMGSHLKRDRILNFLAEVRNQLEVYINDLADENKDLEKNMDYCARSAFHLGLDCIQTYMRWAEKTYKELSESKDLCG